MNTRKKIVIAVYIISLVMILVGGGFRIMILFDWSVPLLPQALVMLAGGEYFDRMDLPFEYLGSARVNDEEVGLADWRSIQYDYADQQQWTFVVDSREEFEERFEKHGIDGKLVRDFDFENNILLLSYTRPIHSVGISEKNRMWKDELPYVYADFTYQAECETNVMYYQALPRVELNFKKDGKIEAYPLHIYRTVGKWLLKLPKPESGPMPVGKCLLKALFKTIACFLYPVTIGYYFYFDRMPYDRVL